MEKIKVIFVLPSLQPGGTERVMSFVAQNLSKDKFETKLVIIKSPQLSKYEVSGIEVIYLNVDRVFKSPYALYKVLRRERPKVVIGSLSHLNTVLGFFSCFYFNTKFVGRESNVPSVLSGLSKSNGSSFPMRIIVKIAYRMLDKVICQSEDMKNDLIDNMGLDIDQIVVINNPVSSKFITKRDISNTDKKFRIITIGRLTQQKGYERILRIVKDMEIPLHYTILGDGPDKDKLINIISNENLDNVVEIIPYSDKVETYLENSHIYFQGSYVEGFPNALIESLAVGTPAVVFKAPGGMNEIIINGENGYLVENEGEFKERASQILSNLSEWTPERVSRYVRNRFGSEIILSEYERLIESLAYR